MFRLLLIALLAITSMDVRAQDADTVVLLHGLLRSSRSMDKAERALSAEGYHTCNIDYPSRKHRIEELATEHVLPLIQECAGAGKVHFVTHSMGGIIARYLIESGQLPNIGRVVMLGPPSQGSEVVDQIGDWWLFEKVNGPAGEQLGTDGDSLPNRLGPATFEVGIIAGTRSINWIGSILIEGEDDGKVSVERAQLEGMTDFLRVPATHTFMMRNGEVLRQTLHFLRHGEFDHHANS